MSVICCAFYKNGCTFKSIRKFIISNFGYFDFAGYVVFYSSREFPIAVGIDCCCNNSLGSCISRSVSTYSNLAVFVILFDVRCDVGDCYVARIASVVLLIRSTDRNSTFYNSQLRIIGVTVLSNAVQTNDIAAVVEEVVFSRSVGYVGCVCNVDINGCVASKEIPCFMGGIVISSHNYGFSLTVFEVVSTVLRTHLAVIIIEICGCVESYLADPRISGSRHCTYKTIVRFNLADCVRAVNISEVVEPRLMVMRITPHINRAERRACGVDVVSEFLKILFGRLRGF